MTGLRAANFVIGELGVGEPIEILQVSPSQLLARHSSCGFDDARILGLAHARRP